MYATIIILALLVVTVIWAVAVYNGLVTIKNQVENAWRQIDVQLVRRHDLIPNLVEAVRGAMDFERETLREVIEARGKAAGASTVKDKSVAEGFLSEALGKLFALVESYPELKSNANVLELQEELASTENRIGFARQYYNDLVAQFNTRQSVFPSVVIANLFGFTQADYFQAKASQKETPQVDLTRKAS